MMKLSDFTILNLFSVINKTCIHEKIETKIVISRRNPPGWTLAEHIKSLRKCSRETPYILGVFLFTSISSCLLNLLCSVQLFLFDDKGHGYVDIDAHQHVWNLRFVRFRESFVTAAYPLRVHDEVCSMCTVITWSYLSLRSRSSTRQEIQFWRMPSWYLLLLLHWRTRSIVQSLLLLWTNDSYVFLFLL